jgi:hypothetical protein
MGERRTIEAEVWRFHVSEKFARSAERALPHGLLKALRVWRFSGERSRCRPVRRRALIRRTAAESHDRLWNSTKSKEL